MAGRKDTQFKEGQSGNPNGRPKLSKEQRAIREGLRSEIAKHMSEALTSSLSSNSEILKKRDGLDISNLEFLIRGAVFCKDWKIINACLDRVIGNAQ